MDSNLLNLMQLQQMYQAQQAQQPMSGQGGAVSSSFPTPPAEGGGGFAPSPSTPSYNPFNAGIRNAIEAARESMAMTQKQQHRALRASLLAFGRQMSQEPVQRGFLNNLGAIGRSALPAIGAYDEAEAGAFSENNNLANQILHYQAAERAQQEKQEEREWRRRMEEGRLNEQMRYHDMINDRMTGRNAPTEGTAPSPEQVVASNYSPMTTKSQATDYDKVKKATGHALAELKDIERDYKEYRKDYADSMFQLGTAGYNLAAPLKDFAGRWGRMKELQEETDRRDALTAKIRQVVTTAERALKGQGQIGIGILKFFEHQDMFPELLRNSQGAFELKLKQLHEALERTHKTADYSLKYKVLLDDTQVYDFEDSLARAREEAQMSALPPEERARVLNEVENGISAGTPAAAPRGDVIEMVDPSGEIYELPANDPAAIQEAENRGLKVYRGG